MLAKAAKNTYSDKQLVEIAMNIIRNKNYFEKGQADWYGKIPEKQTWGDFKTHFEEALRQLRKSKGIPCEARLITKRTFCKRIRPVIS